MKLEFLYRFFEECPDIRFHESAFTGSQVVPCGQTDRYKKADGRFSQLCERT